MDARDHAEDLPRYAEWSPGPGDARGLALPDRQDWRVLATQHRDSDTLDRSNFAAVERALDEVDTLEFQAYENHRFGHWAVGWVEIILVNPEHEPAMRVAGEIVCALADYPVLDEDAWSEIETEEGIDAWRDWGCRDFAHSLAAMFDLSDEAEDLITDQWDLALSWHDAIAGEYFTSGENTVSTYGWTRDRVARMLREMRREQEK